MEVLFDADGVVTQAWGFRTLLDTEYGISPSTTRPFFESRFVDCLTGEADLFDELPPYLDAWGWPGTMDSFVETWFETENRPNERVLAVVSDLRAGGHRCHIASNQERHRARYLRKTMGFGGRFDSLFFSCDLGARKPDSKYYERIETALGRTGPELLFIDDSAHNVEAARVHGWIAVVYTGPESLEEVASMLGESAS